MQLQIFRTAILEAIKTLLEARKKHPEEISMRHQEGKSNLNNPLFKEVIWPSCCCTTRVTVSIPRSLFYRV